MVVCHICANRSLRSKSFCAVRVFEYSWGRQIASTGFSLSSLRSDLNSPTPREKEEAPNRFMQIHFECVRMKVGSHCIEDLSSPSRELSAQDPAGLQ